MQFGCHVFFSSFARLRVLLLLLRRWLRTIVEGVVVGVNRQFGRRWFGCWYMRWFWMVCVLVLVVAPVLWFRSYLYSRVCVVCCYGFRFRDWTLGLELMNERFWVMVWALVIEELDLCWFFDEFLAVWYWLICCILCCCVEKKRVANYCFVAGFGYRSSALCAGLCTEIGPPLWLVILQVYL